MNAHERLAASRALAALLRHPADVTAARQHLARFGDDHLDEINEAALTLSALIVESRAGEPSIEELMDLADDAADAADRRDRFHEADEFGNPIRGERP